MNEWYFYESYVQITVMLMLLLKTNTLVWKCLSGAENKMKFYLTLQYVY